MACTVKMNRHGILELSFLLERAGILAGNGLEQNSTKNRAKAEGRRRAEINEEMEARTFNYLRWFPKGNKAHEFRPKRTTPAENKPVTVRKFYEEWIEKKKPPFVRVSLQRDYQQNFKKNILPFMGDMELNGVTWTRWRAFAFT